jgi:hypothetical protein
MIDRFEEIKRIMRLWIPDLSFDDQKWLVAEVERLRKELGVAKVELERRRKWAIGSSKIRWRPTRG